jgi:hypothetical protein
MLYPYCSVFYIATKIDLKKNPNHFAYGIGENKEEAELNLYKLCPEHRYNFVYFTVTYLEFKTKGNTFRK